MDISVFFEKSELVPVIVQSFDTGEVLMLGYSDRRALELTLESGTVWFFSRSRQKLWNKGETSGNFLHVREIYGDCDNDTILIKAVAQGPTCHTGARSCFFNTLYKNDVKES